MLAIEDGADSRFVGYFTLFKRYDDKLQLAKAFFLQKCRGEQIVIDMLHSIYVGGRCVQSVMAANEFSPL